MEPRQVTWAAYLALACVCGWALAGLCGCGSASGEAQAIDVAELPRQEDPAARFAKH